MSITDVTFTPPGFEDWLEQDDAEPAGRQRCDCCGEHRDCWYRRTPNPDVICEECARRHHAFYVEEEQTVRSLLARLDPLAWRTILELDEMTVDSRVPELVLGYCAELLGEQIAADA